MDRPGGVLSLALVGMLAGGALIPHFAPGPANAPTRTPDRRAEPAPPDPTDGLGPFVDQMAQLMNVDITEQGLIKETARRLQNRTVNAADAEMVRCFFDLDVDRTAAFNTAAKQFTRPDCGATRGSIVPGLSLPESTVDIVKQTLDLSGSREASDSDKTSQVGTSIRQAAATLSGARKSSGETLREDRAAAARRRMAFITIREAASKAFDDPVKFVVVTMPDPVDSYSGWQFDPMLSALAEAAAASRYTLNRFYFPDSPPTHGNGEQPPGHLHERYPGVVIFRHDYRPNGGKAHSSLLVLLTVYETPTSGVHPRALASALRTVVDWHRGDAPRLTDDEPLLLLGPSFSGSSESIRAELDRVRAELGPIRIVSTATSPDNAFVLNSPPDNYVLESPRDITFKATVRSTRVLRDALWTYLSTVVDPRIDAMPKTDALPVLWLVEANTQYGGYREPISPDAETASIPYGRAIVRRFPMHISRIGVEEAARAPGPGVVSRFRSLAIGDEIRPTDQLPFFSPRTTNSYVELVLANILKTISDERIGFVGMIATDARDKMFLAREIRREAPNVVMFTTENDLFYSHPDYFASTGGMLIAAPYPMGTPLQRVSEAQHFPTSTAHGAYNALIALLNYDTGGNRAKGAAPLLQYSAPDCNANCQPPVWISVVGRDRPREIWRYDTPSDPYSFGAEPTETWEVGPLAVGRMVPIGFSIVMLLILFQALHVPRDVRSKLFGMMAAFATAIQTCRVLARWLPKGRLARVREIGHGNAADPLTAKQWAPYSLVASVAMLPVIVLIWGFGWLWLSRSLFDPWGWFFSLTGLLTIGALAVASASCVQNLGSDWRGQWRALSIAAVAAFMAVCLVVFVVGQRTVAELFVGRVANWADGVSPTLPIMMLMAALYCWPAIERYRLSRGQPFRIQEREYVGALLQKRSGEHAKPSFWVMDCANDSILALRPPWIAMLAIPFMLLVAFGFDPAVRPLTTMDGQAFGRFISAGMLLLELMVGAALMQFLCLWRGVSHLLDRISALSLDDAFKRIPKKFFPSGIVPQLPKVSELAYAVGLVKSDSLDTSFLAEVRLDSPRSLSRSSTWDKLLVEASAAVPLVGAESEGNHRQSHEKRQIALLTISDVVMSIASGGPFGESSGVEGTLPEEDREQRRREELVAIPFVFMMRTVLARMWDNVLFVAGAILLLAAAQWGYQLQMKSFIQVMLWVDVLVAVSIVLFVFVQMERDEILSHIASTAPGQISWSSGFLGKLVVYGLIPLAGLFATQFPHVSGTLAQWLEPVQKALP